MNISAVVILYHPDEGLVQRILSYARHVRSVYVFDNTEISPKGLPEQLSAIQNIRYYHDGENGGIALRLNQAAELAIQENQDWLLTMDQDSCFEGNVFTEYVKCIQAFSNIQMVAMFGIQYVNPATDPAICKGREVIHLITSGSMVRLDIFNVVGHFDQALFIDKVDHEYCLRAISKGFKIICFDNIYLRHNLGNVTYGYSLKSFRKTPRVLHSPVRMYYIFRNYLYLRNKFKSGFEESFIEMRQELLNRTKNNFLYGHKRLRLLQYILKGIIDGKKGRMGKARL